PLFGHQYSHVWIDFRGIQDDFMREKGIDYFENSRRATLAQRAYAVDNPAGWRGYGPDVWGLTASDGPVDGTVPIDGTERRLHSYWARGAALDDVRDDGTLAPTAAGGSIPFAPDLAIPALMAMRERWGEHLYGPYGFRDAFNPSLSNESFGTRRGEIVPEVGWFDDQYLGIDQGPIVLMIENWRSGLVWETMKRNDHIVRGLCRAGFRGGWLEGRCS
ncbi:MAG TPA: glucoamylase family protein, partial [Longimicrobiales bacterium]|nr:glucoamylase family protein [Longimicrobiales bacterium]